MTSNMLTSAQAHFLSYLADRCCNEDEKSHEHHIFESKVRKVLKKSHIPLNICLIAVYYFRLCPIYPSAILKYTICLMIAEKVYSDYCYSISCWSEIIGISPAVISELQWDFLIKHRLIHRSHISSEPFEYISKDLLLSTTDRALHNTYNHCIFEGGSIF